MWAGLGWQNWNSYSWPLCGSVSISLAAARQTVEGWWRWAEPAQVARMGWIKKGFFFWGEESDLRDTWGWAERTGVMASSSHHSDCLVPKVEGHTLPKAGQCQ